MKIQLSADRFACYKGLITKQLATINCNISNNAQSLVSEVLLEMFIQAQKKASIAQERYTISFSRAQAITLISIVSAIPETGHDEFTRITFTDIVVKLIKSAPKDLKIFE